MIELDHDHAGLQGSNELVAGINPERLTNLAETVLNETGHIDTTRTWVFGQRRAQ